MTAGSEADADPPIEPDQKEVVKGLESSVEQLRAAADLKGLLHLKELAQVVAVGTTGRVRRKAERVVAHAGSAADDLRREGIETAEERAERERMEAQRARVGAERERARLLTRCISFARLLPREAAGPSNSLAVLRGLAGATDLDTPGGTAGIRSAFDSWAGQLTDGYERSQAIFRDLSIGPVADERPEIVRALKSLAVELLAEGGELRNLKTDAIPLVAYALQAGAVPSAPDANSPETAERTNDLLLRNADGLALMPVEARPALVALLRLAILLGEAQCYAEQLSLTRLPLTAPES